MHKSADYIEREIQYFEWEVRSGMNRCHCEHSECLAMSMIDYLQNRRNVLLAEQESLDHQHLSLWRDEASFIDQRVT